MKVFIAFILQLVLREQVPLLCSTVLEFLVLSRIVEIMGSDQAYESAIRVVIAGLGLLLLCLSPSMAILK